MCYFLRSWPLPRCRIHLTILLLVWGPLPSGSLQAQVEDESLRRPMTAEDLWNMGRVGAPVISPDGEHLAYTVTRYDTGTNRSRTDIWMVSIEGEGPVPLAVSPGTDTAPAWSPDGRWLAFVSNRAGNGLQLHLMPAAGGEARALTSLDGGVGGPTWSRDSRFILFASQVWPEGDPAAARLRGLADRGLEARIYDELMYRHWDHWEDGRRSHVHMIDIAEGTLVDLTPGAYDVPPLALGGFHDYDLNSEGTELAFVRNIDVPTAVGTGNDIWLKDLETDTTWLLTENRANDVAPLYSPDGRYIAYQAMKRPGFEADRVRLVVYDRVTGTHRGVTEALDRSVDYHVWKPDSSGLYFLCQDGVYHSLYRVNLRSGAIDQLTRDRYISRVAVTPDGSRLVAVIQSHTLPAELFLLDAQGAELMQLTDTNAELLARLDLSPIERFTFTGASGDQVEGFLVKPPGFDPALRYPVVYLVHGGPQGAWSDVFHYRWNASLFAAPGYVAVLVNPRGSTGYGQRFTDEISRDWGGKVFEDLMRGLDYILQHYPYLDPERMAAAGASYGGYMMNWFQGHTRRFRTLINHDGVTELVSMYGSTEELWFPEWEFGGAPWDHPQEYERWNPMAHAKSFATPMLIIHGGLDYRVPLDQGLIMFTALRRQQIPARLLYFPDEGHWVLKPRNGLLWWETVHEWLETWLRP